MCEKFFKKFGTITNETNSKCTRCQRDLKIIIVPTRGAQCELSSMQIVRMQFWRMIATIHTCICAENKSLAISAPSDVSCYIFSLWPSLCTARYNHPQSVVGQELWNWLSTPSLSHSPLSSRTNFVPAQSGVRLFELILTSALYLVLPRIRFSERLRESRWKISPLQSDLDYAYDILSRMIMLFVTDLRIIIKQSPSAKQKLAMFFLNRARILILNRQIIFFFIT